MHGDAHIRYTLKHPEISVRIEMLWCGAILFPVALAMGLNIDGGTWPNQQLTWSPHFPQTKFLHEDKKPEETKTSLEDLIQKSNQFPIKFPSNATRCVFWKSKRDSKTLENHINSAHPLLHEQSLQLFVSFLEQKRRFGTSKERTIYTNMTLLGLIDRLLTKRAVSFAGNEEYLLIDGTKGTGGWENEKNPLVLEKCLSYEEIKLAGLLLVASESLFIEHEKIEGDGVVIGAVWPRLDKEKVLDYREIVKTAEQNTHVYGYGNFFVPTMQGIFLNFYGDGSATYQQLENTFADVDRYIKIADDEYFDKWIYSRRIALSIDCVLMEASARALKQNTTAFIDVTLDQWKITPEQDQLFLDTFRKRITFLGPLLSGVSDVAFSHVGNNSIDEKIPIQGHPSGGVKLTVRDQKPEDGKLVVVVYNWNGNALPGNEFWTQNGGKIAESTQITELHNPLINDKNVRGANLRIVTIKGIVTFWDYVKNVAAP